MDRDIVNKEKYFTDYGQLINYINTVDNMIERAAQKDIFFKYNYQVLIGANNYILNINFTQ
jgi:hypothetical protein